jgi:DNA anti-recombination protein RmuC
MLSATVILMSVREAWTDERLDDLSKKMDQGFSRLEAEVRALNGRFDSLQKTLLQVNWAIVAALIGLIATQL